MRPTLELHLKANVKQEIINEPGKFNLGKLGMDEKSVLEFSLKVARPDLVRITGVESPNNEFSIESLDDGLGEISRFKLHFEGRNRPGGVSGVVLVHYEGPLSGKKRIRVQGTIESAIEYPRLVRFSKAGDEFPAQTITIKARNGDKVHIASIVDRGHSLEWDYDDESGASAMIRARVIDQTKSYVRMKRGTLVVTTSEPVESTFEITYMISSGKR